MKTRPTADMVREALFNILGIKVIDSIFLDIFAGTGAVGLEALSRGAKRAVFVEKDVNACSIIAKNLEELKIENKAEILKSDAIKAIKILNKKEETFDIIFIDPPYNKNYIALCIDTIKKYDIMKPDGLLILQHSVNENFKYNGFSCLKQKKYGKTLLTLLIKE